MDLAKAGNPYAHYGYSTVGKTKAFIQLSVSVLVGSVVALISPLPPEYSAKTNPTIRALCEAENMSVLVT